MTSLVDDDARARIRSDFDTTFVVEAAAGTGKTSELVSRVVHGVRVSRMELDRLVLVTFTDKAAGEMKLRLRAELDRARALAESADERRRFDQALSRLEIARIGTIHWLCGEVLRTYALAAHVDPEFEIVNDSSELFAEAFDRWFDQIESDPGEGIRRFLVRRLRNPEGKSARSILRDQAAKLAERRDFRGRFQRTGVSAEELRDVVLECERVGCLANRAGYDRDYLKQSLEGIASFAREAAELTVHQVDPLEGLLSEFARAKHWEYRGKGEWYGKELRRTDVLRIRDDLSLKVKSVAARLDADLAACLRDELEPVGTLYEQEKRERGRLDFLDLLLRTRDLLREHPTIRAEITAGISHLSVDEFQDTDPLQADILLMLAGAEPGRGPETVPRGKLFVVGDPKQSIYRFRRADVGFYESVKEGLVAAGAEVLYLRTSFRSTPEIQSLVNAAFAPAMSKATQGQQTRYVALEPFREKSEQPSVIALPIPEPYGRYGRIAEHAIARSAPDAVAAFLEYLIRESPFTVTERGGSGGRTRIEPRHVCLLFKRFQKFGSDVTSDYVRALEARGLPHVLVGGRSFYAREEVLAIRNALTAIEWPTDELSVYATLRGPFFGITDDLLFLYRARFGRLSPAAPIPDEALSEPFVPVAEALRILSDLYPSRNHRAAASTIALFLEKTRAHSALLLWPSGEEALRNVERIMDVARRFEGGSGRSFRAFVEYLEVQAERGDSGEGQMAEQGALGIRMMTVHRAKGLEFPVVVLADPTAPRISGGPTRYVDPARGVWAESICGFAPSELNENREQVLAEDDDEAIRVAYVAATRARDLLVAPVVGDEPVAGWFDVLNPALYPMRDKQRTPLMPSGLPRFGGASVLKRPPEEVGQEERSVAPGIHFPQAGNAPVLFWDPALLLLQRKPYEGLAHQAILSADSSGAESPYRREYEDWKARRAVTREMGARESRVIRNPTLLDAGEEDATVSVEFVSQEDRSKRPRGKRFGILVHAVLCDADFRLSDESLSTKQVEQLASLHARLLSASDEEIRQAVDVVGRTLRHPRLVEAKEAHARGVCRRETTISYWEEKGGLVEGIVDLAYAAATGSGKGWVVVDYKTDAELSDERLRHYRVQVGAYTRAIALATGTPVSGVVLVV